MGAQETRALKEQFMILLNQLDNINIEHCNKLKDDLYQQQWNDLVNLSMIHDDVYDNCIINVVDAPYNINTILMMI